MSRKPVDSQEPLPADRSQTKFGTASNSSSAKKQRRDFLSDPNRPRGQKRRFGAAGVTNVLITNLVLQALLASSVVGVTAATLISQVINTCLGYAIYGKMVFKAERLRHHRPLLSYLLLMTGMWLLNAAGIASGEALGVNKNLAAAGLIPCLAMLSFLGQKYWVFK
jgi:putative flippase GtrA